MGRKAEAKSAGAVADGSSVTVASTTQKNHPSVSSTPDALISLAEDLGRLPARRELAKTRDRRACALPELLLGASVVTFALILIARALGWLAR